MKSFALIVLLAVAISANPILEDEEDISLRVYPRYITVPDGNEEPHQEDLEDSVDEDLLRLARDPANNRYILFTRRNPHVGQELYIHNADSVLSSYFNPHVGTVVIAHGWNSDRYSSINPYIRDAYLGHEDVNVIVLDWGRLANANYISASRGVPAVGIGLAHFIHFLENFGLSLDRLHLVGFSLGAHLVGNTGRELQGRVRRVTGLDPAGPLWTSGSDRIRETDARYVECIHTDGDYLIGGLGIGSAICQADHFPNGGRSMPGCWTGTCNHSRAWRYFAATVTYNHIWGNECSSSWQITWNNCRGNLHAMGNGDFDKSGSGRFRANTGRDYPY